MTEFAHTIVDVGYVFYRLKDNSLLSPYFVREHIESLANIPKEFFDAEKGDYMSLDGYSLN